MKRETLVIRPDKHKRRIGILPTYAQRDRTKYTRKAKHRGQDGRAGSIESAGEYRGKMTVFQDALVVAGCPFVSPIGQTVSGIKAIVSPQRRISSVGRAITS